ncbi:MAG TPA: aminotransferase class V-fold PLP-dependent enzyme [Patescibacteria group bacterium]|nr:aminotransferase class V-fold PLP-dependent enzyme [Patescibacteria group bacterium]
MNHIRNEFSFFEKNPNVIYFDNASTTQKPKSVINSINDYLTSSANAGRGSYTLASQITNKVDEVRRKVADMVNAYDLSEVVFTSGATESLNTVAYSWGLHNLKTADEILVCYEDHDSNVLPWINLEKTLSEKGIKIKIVPFKNTSAGDANIDDIVSKVTSKTRLIALTHIHNVYGTKSDIELLRDRIGQKVLLSVDASQSIGHIKIDVQALKVDFLSFSGHKMFALTGIGVLWVNKRVHKYMKPFLTGGQTQDHMSQLLEAGTQNLAGIVSLGAAIDFINKISIEKIEQRILNLSQYLLTKLRGIEGIEFLPGIANCRCAVGYGVLSFNISTMNPSEVGFILSEKDICVRAGTHCTGKGDNLNNSVRVSLHIYNTEEEIDKLIKAIEDIVSN